jgi:uncharacterized protein (DUF433 family)
MVDGGAADHEAELDLAAMSMKQRDSCGSFGHMARTDGSTQRLIRLSRRTLEQLDAMAQATGESHSALADRLLSEAIKTAVHPLIRFQQGALDRRRALVVGTRLYVYQVILTVRGNDGDADQTAEDLGLAPQLVRDALAYYADYTDEIDEDAAAAGHLEREERERWERQPISRR